MHTDCLERPLRAIRTIRCHLQGLPHQSRYELKRAMEKHAVKNGVKVIDLPTLFEARPDPTKVFPQAARQCFDRHSGPVYAISASPFHRNLFLTCSTDGLSFGSTEGCISLGSFSNSSSKWSLRCPRIEKGPLRKRPGLHLC